MPRSEGDEAGAIAFGPFRLFPARRLLEKDGAPLHVGARALDILIVLAERAGEVVSKKELMARVWPDVIVEDVNLRVNVAELRRALGDGQSGARYLANVPGRGYCLVEPLTRSPLPAASPSPPRAAALSQDLPPRLSRMVGRQEVIGEVSHEIMAHRFVTVVGPGGIGKTTVAVEVAHTLLERFDGAVHFLDLGPLGDGQLVPTVLASALGLAVDSDQPIDSVIESLRHTRLLLVLDSCEHVIEAASAMAEAIFQNAPEVHILATSREALRVEGERIRRLFPLPCPPANSILPAAEVLTFPAAQLFVERVGAMTDGFVLGDQDAPVVAEICVKLDGIALALELAAGQVGAYGIEAIARLLDDRLGLLWQGRRTALPRHQTLSATLDWSYDLLSEVERAILRRLAVFVGFFTLEAAQFVAADEESGQAQVVHAIADLVAKSLVAAEIGATPTRYRLLDTTRAYVMGKPLDSTIAAATARRHALYYCQHLERAPSDPANRPGPSRDHIGNIRAALEWSFGPAGDLDLAIGLASASAQFFLEMSMMTECHRWTERAIAVLEGVSSDPRREMELRASLAISLMFTRGNKEEVRSALLKSLEVAESLNDPEYQLRLLSGLNIFLVRVGDHRGALAIGQRAAAIADRLGDPAGRLMSGWLVGVAHHLIGDQAAAEAHCSNATTRIPVPQWGSFIRFGYDRRIIALVTLARTLWLVGKPDEALAAARHTIREAESLGHPVTLCISFIWAVYVFLWTGDWTSAEDIVERLLAQSAQHFLGPYHAVGNGLKGELAVRRGDADAGIPILRDSLEVLQANRHQILVTVFASALAEGLAAAGQAAEALRTVDVAIDQAGESFDRPEMLRIRGEFLAQLGRAGEAEASLLRAIELARRQSALGWELRSATSLARLWSVCGRETEARGLLAPLYGRFAQGLDTLDLETAKALLDRLARPAA